MNIKQNIAFISDTRAVLADLEELIQDVEKLLRSNFSDFDRKQLEHHDRELKLSRDQLTNLGHADERWSRFARQRQANCKEFLQLIGKPYFNAPNQ